MKRLIIVFLCSVGIECYPQSLGGVCPNKNFGFYVNCGSGGLFRNFKWNVKSADAWILENDNITSAVRSAAIMSYASEEVDGLTKVHIITTELEKKKKNSFKFGGNVAVGYSSFFDDFYFGAEFCFNLTSRGVRCLEFEFGEEAEVHAKNAIELKSGVFVPQICLKLGYYFDSTVFLDSVMFYINAGVFRETFPCKGKTKIKEVNKFKGAMLFPYVGLGFEKFNFIDKNASIRFDMNYALKSGNFNFEVVGENGAVETHQNVKLTVSKAFMFFVGVNYYLKDLI